jgi:Uma2 family endonuclease
MLVARPHHQFSVAEYEQMIDLGILTENDRVELIRGEIVKKMSIGDLHAAAVILLTRLFHRKFIDSAIVSIQNPIALADSEPEPDIALLKVRDDCYASGRPRARDVLLLIEVPDTTLRFDRYDKGSLYAENGVAEYWILNLIDRTLEVHRDPQSSGQYAEVRVLALSDATDIVSLPGVTLAVGDLFPPAQPT